MKKWKAVLGGLFLLGLSVKGLEYIGVIDPNGQLTAKQKEARDVFIADWNRLVGEKANLEAQTIVVYVTNDQNPFKNKADYANEYRPSLVNGQSCKDLGIRFIQVRSARTDELLSGISCRD